MWCFQMGLFRVYAPSECVSNWMAWMAWMAPHKAAGRQARAHPDPVAPVVDQHPLTFPGRLNGIIIPSVSRRTQLVYVVPLRK